LFYTTLVVVPKPVQAQVGVAYLLARAADTIADTDVIERPRRLEFLAQFRAQFLEDDVNWRAVREIREALVPQQVRLAERALLERLEECFFLYLQFPPEDRRRVRRLLTTLTQGMVMDLTRFPGNSASQVTALTRPEELDQYTYLVAGCVGEFWTDLMCGHCPALARWNPQEMSALGVRFGKGLQLTNILKDLAKDVHRGRCYLPESWLRDVGLAPADLANCDVLSRVRPVVRRVAAIAREHLDQGWAYAIAIPRREVRLRLACMWPILSAGETLRLVLATPHLLDPNASVKISRGRVYQMMAWTTLTGGCGAAGTAYWSWLRKQIG
jgi:farnesyl-diphosphate farnesyltransferase